MFDFIQSALQPYIVEAGVLLLSGIVMWFGRFLPESMRLKIEANHRQALHSAMDTAVGLVLDTAQKHPAIAVPDAIISRGLGYVYGSVPNAIKKLGPSRQQLELMLRSKLQLELDKVLGRDRLTEVLITAGLDAKKP